MSEGYPDYQRLSASGGFQLFATSNTAPENTILFQGYVGNWPYINLFIDLASGTDSFQFWMVYYSDSTFTVQTGFRVSVRQSSQFSCVQYGNISNWMIFYYLSKSGSAFTGTVVSLQATVGTAPNVQLMSLDTPMFFFSGLVAASGNVNESVQKVCPGPAKFSWYTTATVWTINIQIYDYGSNVFKTVRVLSNGVEAAHGDMDLPMIDCTYQVNIVNGDAAARTFILQWNPE